LKHTGESCSHALCHSSFLHQDIFVTELGPTVYSSCRCVLSRLEVIFKKTCKNLVMEEHRINCKRGPSFSPEQSSVTVHKNNKSLIKKNKKLYSRVLFFLIAISIKTDKFLDRVGLFTYGAMLTDTSDGIV